ncbi:hypothetical protein DOK67_0002255 [Enterococcus sp. DIV0212c]|uniref:MucBP domain-containing protein n=1 Tax=Enterococcus sp. DIV0212c TaxID=2230867 RepID=UPI001A9B07A3|nr:MucBP domain-containing protein [Enterococcus sp. DIV0212c]MBO1355340.1 MucBP domain-containing protein [Enterococcus sp. DIV0212c]
MKKYSYLLLIVTMLGLNPITGRAEENVNTGVSETTEQKIIPDVNVVESNGQAGESSLRYGEEQRENEEYKYSIANSSDGGGMVILNEYIGTSKDVVIPSEIDGFPVKQIGPSAFEDKKLNSVVIPEGITYIGAWAFALNNLYSIKLPNSLKKMSLGAFAACRLSSISMPDNVEMDGTTSGGADQFYNQWSAIKFSRGKKITLDKLFKFDSGPITLDDIDIVSIDKPTVTFEDGEFKIPQEIKQFTITFGSHTEYGERFYYGKYNVHIKDTPAEPLSIKYIDQNGVEIHEQQTISGNIGDSYDASTDAYKLAIDGYTLDESKLPDNTTGTLSDTGQTVTYTYIKDGTKAKDATVRYLDQEGSDIHKPQTISGNIGDSYDASTDTYKLLIDGYTLDESKLPDNAIGILSDIDQTVTYTYTKDSVKAQDATVRYLDQEGSDIHKPQTISGNIGDSYDASTDTYKLLIDGYTLDESKLPDNAIGILSDIDQTVTYTYTKDSVKAQDVTVRYLDQEGKDIHKPQTISGNIGDSYDASTDVYKLLIDGYTLDESKLPENTSGTLSDTGQTVTYIYTKDSVKAQNVTVRYLDQEGKDIHKPQTISGNIGDSYDASTDAYKLSIADYTLDKSKLPENMTGILSDTEQVITYVYNKNQGIVEPSQPANPVKPTESKPTATTKPKVESTHILPRTGEQALAWVSGIGIVLVVAVGFIFYKKRQSNSN